MLRKGGKMVFVFKLWHISPPSCVGGLMAPEIWNGFSNFFFLVLWQWYSHGRALPFPPRQCDSWACMLMCACLYTLVASVPYRFNQTRLAEETEKCPISSWIPTLHITICTGQVEVKVRSGLWLFFSPPERNLTSCLAVIRRFIYLFFLKKSFVKVFYS